MTGDRVASKLNRIEGQIKGIKKMYQEGRECEEIVQQVKAAREALGGIAKDLLSDEAVRCSKCKTKQKKFDKTIKKLFDIS